MSNKAKTQLTIRRPGRLRGPGRPRAVDQILDKIEEEPLEEVRRLNVIVSLALHGKMKMQAVLEGRTMSEITLDLWEEYLKKMKKS